MQPWAQGLLNNREDLKLTLFEKQTQLLQCKINTFQTKMVPSGDRDEENCQRNSCLAPFLSAELQCDKNLSQGFLKTSSCWCHAFVGGPGCCSGVRC